MVVVVGSFVSQPRYPSPLSPAPVPTATPVRLPALPAFADPIRSSSPEF